MSHILYSVQSGTATTDDVIITVHEMQVLSVAARLHENRILNGLQYVL